MKSFFKKLLCVVLLLCSIAGFSACGDDVDYSHTIVFYHSQGQALQPKTAIAIAKFEAKYPGWKVEQVPCGGYDDVKSKVVSDLQAHIQPDLAYCYADHVALYLKTGMVYDMATLINSTEKVDAVFTVNNEEVHQEVMVGYSAEEIADFVPGYYAEGFATNYADYDTYGFSATSMLTLPFQKSTDLLYVNLDALVGANIVDENGKAKVATTWEELWEQCAVLKEKYPSCTPIGVDSEANWFITMCEQNGWGYTSASEPHYLFNNSEAAAWLEQLQQYSEKEYITTKIINGGGYTSELFRKGVKDDASGIVYCIGSSGGASNQAGGDFKWGVYPIPGSASSTSANPYAAISQGPSLVMFKTERSENVEEKAKMTFLFIKELLDPTFQATFSMQSGYCAVRKSTQEVEAYADHMNGSDITAVAAKVASSMSERYFASPAFVGSSTARTQVGNALVYVLGGSKSAEQALRDAYLNCGGK